MEFNWTGIKQPLLDWYRKGHRELKWRETTNPYFIWVSEIMLQQTRVEAVKGYYDRFLNELPDIKALAEVSEDKLLKLWEGLGYYNRARNLQKAAICIMEEFDGVFPSDYERVRGLPGIGEYTAGAICSICFGLPVPAVDGNVLRVIMRISDCRDNIDEQKTKQAVRKNLLPLYGTGDCGELTQALMELGAVICVPKGEPKCEECPLGRQCLAYANDTYRELPVRRAKQKRRIEEKTVFILHDGSRYGIQKRGENGLLANMWEFYHTAGRLDAQDAVRYIGEQGFEPVALEKEVPYTHIFSHVEWRMTAYYIECRKRQEMLTWAEKEELETVYALPSAFRVFLEKEF
ncbi:MAG: A/G-specific adenine glycosylase [Bacteroidales bacterium]|nr:A/G-specific adenine glycosylase [Clostridium sp.]MCM1203081.1 A/G-specific adenine glycosylase [Bacteroidales bacterium]